MIVANEKHNLGNVNSTSLALKRGKQKPHNGIRARKGDFEKIIFFRGMRRKQVALEERQAIKLVRGACSI